MNNKLRTSIQAELIDISSRLTELRETKGLTKKQLADQLGIAPSLISEYEASTKLPSVNMIIRLAHYYHVSTDYILGYSQKLEEEAFYIEAKGLTLKQREAVENLLEAFRTN